MHCSVSAALSAACAHGGPDGLLTAGLERARPRGKGDVGSGGPVEPGLLDIRNRLEDRRPASPSCQARVARRAPHTCLAAASL